MDQMLSKFQPIALSLFRFITGLLLFQYGVAKLFKFPAWTDFANPAVLADQTPPARSNWYWAGS